LIKLCGNAGLFCREYFKCDRISKCSPPPPQKKSVVVVLTAIETITKVVVVVNTASFCGFTSQYEGLEALNSKYKDKGLVVLGFPSNDFSQETGSNKQIADFCANSFGVKFPMFTKTTVSGKDASPLFQQLSAKSGTPPKWNFYKYVIARDGQSVVSCLTTKAALRWKSHGAAEALSRVGDGPCKADFYDTFFCSFPLKFQELEPCRMRPLFQALRRWFMTKL